MQFNRCRALRCLTNTLRHGTWTSRCSLRAQELMNDRRDACNGTYRLFKRKLASRQRSTQAAKTSPSLETYPSGNVDELDRTVSHCIFSLSEELQSERDRSKTLQNEMERCFSDLQLL